MSDVMDPETRTTWFSWNKGQLEKARNERGGAQHPHLAAAWGVAECLPVSVLVVASITQLQNTRINKHAPPSLPPSSFCPASTCVLCCIVRWIPLNGTCSSPACWTCPPSFPVPADFTCEAGVQC